MHLGQSALMSLVNKSFLMPHTMLPSRIMLWQSECIALAMGHHVQAQVAAQATMTYTGRWALRIIWSSRQAVTLNAKIAIWVSGCQSTSTHVSGLPMRRMGTSQSRSCTVSFLLLARSVYRRASTILCSTELYEVSSLSHDMALSAILNARARFHTDPAHAEVGFRSITVQAAIPQGALRSMMPVCKCALSASPDGKTRSHEKSNTLG